MTGADARAPSPHEVRRFLSHLLFPGGILEIRVPKYGKYKLTASGYFDDLDAASEAATRWDGKANVYVTLNPIQPSLLARAKNRVLERADHTTADADVLTRRWILVDVDAVRPAGISSTGTELAAAANVATAIADHLRDAGWPDPVEAMSGNGHYLLYAIDLPNDARSTDLVRGVLERLAAGFDEEGAHVDRTVYNASRIVGLVGTLKVKGDSLPERPHRRSQLLRVPDELIPVSSAQLHSLSSSPERQNLTIVARNSDSLADTLRAHGIEYREQPPDANGVTWYHVRQCPFHDDGRPFECGVGQKLPDGPYARHCFHPEGQGKGWREWKVALGLAAAHNSNGAASVSSLPQIVVSHRHRKSIAEEAWAALMAANQPPKLFRHGRDIAQLVTDDYGHTVIDHLSIAALGGHVDRCADFMKAAQGDLVPARPPRDVIEDMDAMSKPLPFLRGIVGTPIFAADGTLVTDVGYQPLTGLFYQPVGTPVAPVPARPDDTHLRMAKQMILLDWLGDFPFVDDASRAHTVALVITAVAREMIDGPTPLFANDAPSAGTGKGLLVTGAGMVITGKEPALTTPPRDETELRKFLITKLSEGTPLVVFDNLKRRLDSASLAAVLTADVWTDRILGGSKSADVPVRNVWICTGNNLQFTDEVARRIVWTRLDAKRDRPWEGRSFRHPDLKGWLRLHRHELVWAFLVLVQNWVARGRPAWDGSVLASYEEWSRVVGGVLQATGIGGFLENREELYQRTDAVSEEWRRFTSHWWECQGERPVAVGDLLEPAQELIPSAFGKVRDDATERSLRTRLGRALGEQRDRRFGDVFVRDAGTDKHTKGGLWRLERAADAEGATTVAPPSAHLPQKKEPVSDSFAEGAELAEVDPAPNANKQVGSAAEAFAGEGADQHPPHPQVPQSDSRPAAERAEGVRMFEAESGDLPQELACVEGCARTAGRGQRCTECARALVEKWRQ